MLINCPRCGFSQPKDQYCASCGVNMEKYVPHKKSSLQNIFSSTLFQVLIIALIALGTAYWALQNKSQTDLMTSLNSSTLRKKQNFSTLNANGASPVETATAADEPAPEVVVEAQNEAQRNEIAGAITSSTDTTTAVATTTDETKKSIPIKYSYYEVDRAILNYWLQLNAATFPPDESGLFRVGEVKLELFKKQILSEPIKTETKKVNLAEDTNFSAGVARDTSDSFIGLMAEFNLTEISDAKISGVVRLNKKNSQNSELVRVPIAASKQNIYFIHWKNDLSGFVNEATLNNIPPFQILRSQRFLDQKTELVIVIEPIF